MPLHLIKLSVGTRSLADLRRRQAHWGAAHPPLRHTTRNVPRRAAEVVAGGSIYWVIDGLVLARQRVRDILAGDRAAGSKGCDLVLDPVLVPVQARLVKPFQGWRYLAEAAAPPDADGGEELPAGLQRDLARLGLL